MFTETKNYKIIIKRFQPVVIIASIFLLFLLVHHSLIANFANSLYDWNDYPLMAWIIDQQIDNLLSGDIKSYFSGNIFFPYHQKSLLYSDLLFPQAIIGTLLSLVSEKRNVILNILFLFTWLANISSSWYLWKDHLKGLGLFLATLLTAFMPFIWLNSSHFQLLQISLLLIGLKYLLDQEISFRKAIILGVLWSFTFMTSVYLAVFFGWMIATWVVVNSWLNLRNPRFFFEASYYSLTLFSTVVIMAGWLIFAYLLVHQEFNQVRSYHEVVNYSSSLTDYFSTSNYRSLLSNSSFFSKWNQFFKISIYSTFPTFTVIVLSILGIRKIYKTRTSKSNQFLYLFFGLLVIQGFIFSLGPRLKFNNAYIGFPLPYAAVLKIFPVFEVIRVTARWMLLFNIGLLYFSIEGIKAVQHFKWSERRKTTLILLFSILYLIEIIPINKNSVILQHSSETSSFLANICSHKKRVMLEYPILHNPYGDIRGVEIQLQHWSSILYSATKHDCLLVNGYSGFFPPLHDQLANNIKTSIENKNCQDLRQAINNFDVSIIRIYENKLLPDEYDLIFKCFPDFEATYFDTIHHDQTILVK